MSKGKRRLRSVASVLAAALVLIIVGYLLPGERALLKRSTQISSTSTWMNDIYTWETDRSLIFMRHDDAQDACLLFRLDPTSHRESPLVEFNRGFGAKIVSIVEEDNSPIIMTRALAARLGNMRVQPASYLSVPGLTFSPDGKWLACSALALYPGNGGVQWTLCTLDGKRRVNIPPLPGPANESQGMFTADNQWISMTQSYGSVGASRFILRSIEPALGPPITKPNPHPGAEIIGVAPDHQVVTNAVPLIGGAQFTGVGTPETFVTSMERPAETERQLHLYTPPERPYEAILSPDGLRVASCVHTATRLPGPLWFQKIVAGLSGKPKLMAQVRVSRVDGTDMREIGHLPANIDSPLMYSRAENPHALKWTPDGKRLSFVYHSTLYTVPIE